MKHIKEFQLNEEHTESKSITQKKKDFDKFITGLEKLSKTYGFALQITGGIMWSPQGESIEDIEYSRDLLSGDIGIINILWSNLSYDKGTLNKITGYALLDFNDENPGFLSFKITSPAGARSASKKLVDAGYNAKVTMGNYIKVEKSS